jgi:peroxiredoxin
MKKLLVVLLIAAPLLVYGQTQSATTQDQIEKAMQLTRSDVAAEKVQVITKAMAFTPEESAKFWPVYNQYQQELKKIGDQKWSLIKNYADHYSTMDDATAGQLTNQALDLEAQRVQLMQKYVPEFQKVLTPRRTARLMQVEAQLNRLIDLKVASQIPLMP